MKGNTLEFSNDENLVHVWFSKTTNCFCIQLNAQVIESLKNIQYFQNEIRKFVET